MAVTGTEAQILDALLWGVGQMTTTPATQVAYPGVSFNPTIGIPYLAVNILPNTADIFGSEFDSDVDYQGLAQVSVFWPSGQGLVKPQQVVSQVAKAFAPGTKITRNGIQVRIDQKPVVAPALVETDWVQVPVTIRWRVFVPATA